MKHAFPWLAYRWAAPFLLVWPLAGPVHAAEGQCAKPVEAVTEYGLLTDPVVSVSAAGSQRRKLPREPGVAMRYAMLRLKVEGSQRGNWLLTIRDQDFKPLALFGSDDFPQAGPAQGFWTRRVEASDIDLDLFVADPQFSDVRITVDEALVMPAEADRQKARYSWRGNQATYVSLYGGALPSGDEARRSLRRLGDAVGFVVGMARKNDQDMMSWCCSGVMLTHDLFLTNWHCGGLAKGFPEESVWAQSVCDTTFLDLSWDEDQTSRELGCKEVIKTQRQKELDYTLIRVAPLAGERALHGARPLRVASQRAEQGAELRVIHHAECKKKLVSFDCHVKVEARAGRRPIPDANPPMLSDFAHDCDTEGGSSGAPVFDAGGVLVGLHRAGHENTPQGCDEQNKAVHIEHILDDIKTSKPEIYDAIHKNIHQITNQ